MRMIPVDGPKGIVWTEDAPEVCSSGHDALTPTWAPCAQCGFACRHWYCRECREMVRDDVHVHGRPGSPLITQSSPPPPDRAEGGCPAGGTVEPDVA